MIDDGIVHYYTVQILLLFQDMVGFVLEFI